MAQGPGLHGKGFGFYPQGNGKTLKMVTQETERPFYLYYRNITLSAPWRIDGRGTAWSEKAIVMSKVNRCWLRLWPGIGDGEK